MQWSNFVYKIQGEGNVRIKSSKNLITIELGNAEYKEIEEKLLNSNDSVSSLYIEQLKNIGMIIDDSEEEKSEFYNDITEAVEKISDEFTITITPTLKCNFHCTYCYENGTERGQDISEEKIDKIFEWIKSDLIDRKGIQKLHFKLFGGEPLFVEEKILKYLFYKIKKLDVAYTTGIITNGFFLTDSKCKILLNRNLEYLQITLDGPQEYHDKIRLLKNGGPTYQIIMNNLERAIKMGISETFIIRINCCNSNILLVSTLIIEVANRFSKYKDRIIYSFGLVGKSYDSDMNKVIEDDALKREDGSLDKYIELYKLVKELGYRSMDYYAISALCSNKVRDSIIIQADGNIVKCLRGVGRNDFCEANINEIKIPNRVVRTDLYDKCFEEQCPYIPFCHYGCQYGYFIENMEKSGRNCQRELLDYINLGLLRIMY